ncbi:MAG: hypothetical protein KG012_21755 [Deltaproteobacteria bacterium]|nr:hypothetical protein [Deltaproteobacteria bacterium]
MDTFFIDELNMCTIEYTKYKNIIPSGDNLPQGTLLWEFGKNISFVIYDHQNDTDTIKLSSELAAQYYANIDVRTLLTKAT